MLTIDAGHLAMRVRRKAICVYQDVGCAMDRHDTTHLHTGFVRMRFFHPKTYSVYLDLELPVELLNSTASRPDLDYVMCLIVHEITEAIADGMRRLGVEPVLEPPF